MMEASSKHERELVTDAAGMERKAAAKYRNAFKVPS
jgi:hypothetical protein